MKVPQQDAQLLVDYHLVSRDVLHRDVSSLLTSRQTMTGIWIEFFVKFSTFLEGISFTTSDKDIMRKHLSAQ